MKPTILSVATLLAACGLLVAEAQNAMSEPKNAVNAVSESGDQAGAKGGQAESQSLYDLSSRTLEGQPAELSQYLGKVALVVNVASRCGFTRQYSGLETLHKELSDKGFTVLGFPSNDFGAQEPGSAEEIREFCSSTYGVTFPMFEKMPVKGDKKSEIYRFLTQGQEEPTWNFTKYLIAKDGTVLERFDSKTEPDDPDLRKKIEAALAG